MLFLNFRERTKLQVSKNKALREIYETKRDTMCGQFRIYVVIYSGRLKLLGQWTLEVYVQLNT